MSGNNNSGNSNGQKKGGTVLFIILVVVIIALLAAVLVLLIKNKSKQTEEAGKRNVVATKDNVEEVVEQMHQDEYIEPGYYNCTMTNTWHYAKGDSESEDAYVKNVPENTNDVYFDIVLANDEDHVIYQSPVLPRGAELDRIKLDEKLDAGTYDCVTIYHLVDEEQNTVSTLRVGLTIIVEG